MAPTDQHSSPGTRRQAEHGPPAPETTADGADSEVATLVARAARGDRAAWEALVDRYVALIWSVTREFRLGESDAADVTQTTWLRLCEHIDRLADPPRVGLWLATTARRECLRLVALRSRVVLTADGDEIEARGRDQPDVDHHVLAEEQAGDVRRALRALPARWQRLLELLMADPPMSYAEISAQLGLPVGSIGPTRSRCLDRLRPLLRE